MLALSSANDATTACEAAGGNPGASIEADDGGLSMDDRTAADEARADLEEIRSAADRDALVAMDFLNCFIDPSPSPGAENELATLGA